MLIVLATVSALALGILWFFAPSGEVIHAARSRQLLFRRRAFPLASFYRDANGNPIDISNSVLGVASGTSCVDYGIPDGSVVIAEKIASDAAVGLKPGDVVVINAELANGTRPQRFRYVESLAGDMVNFRGDETGPLKPKRLDEILGRVKYIQA